jgi:hypothetical protein
MTQKLIIVGTPNSREGDSLFAAFTKVNENFIELYTALGLDVAPLNLGAFEFTGSVLSTTDSSSIVIDQAVSITSNLTLDGSLTFLNNTVQTTAWTGNVSSLVNGVHQLVLNVTSEQPYVTFPAVSGSNVYVQGGEINVDGIGVASAASLTSLESYVKLSANAAGTRKEWTFGTNGTLTFPDSTTQTTAWTGSTTVSSLVNSGKTLSLDTDGELALPTNSYTEAVIKELDATALVLFAQKANANIKLLAGATSAGSAKQWLFDGTAGRTMFPNGTVPARSYGAAGDKEGMVVFSDPYIYYCKTDYVNDTTDIWVRVAWTGTSW